MRTVTLYETSSPAKIMPLVFGGGGGGGSVCFFLAGVSGALGAGERERRGSML